MNSKAKVCNNRLLALFIASCILASVSADFTNVVANTEAGMATTLPGPVNSGYSFFEYSTGQSHFSFCTTAQFGNGLSIFNWKGAKQASAQNPNGDNLSLISKNPMKLFASSSRAFGGSTVSSISRYGFTAMGTVISLSLEQQTSLSFVPYNLLNSPADNYIYVYGETTIARWDYTSTAAPSTMASKPNSDSTNSDMVWLLYSPYIVLGAGTGPAFHSVDPTTLATAQVWTARSETWIMLNNDMVADVLFADCNDGSTNKVYALCGYQVNLALSPAGALSQYKTFYPIDAVNLINFPKFGFIGVGVDYTKNLVTLSKTELTLVWTYELAIKTELDGATPSRQKPASYYSMIGGVHSDGSFYFSATESVNNNVQFIGVDNCAARTSGTCTSCLPGYSRGASSDKCLMASQFPEQTGLNTTTKQYTACKVSNCQSCSADYSSCWQCQEGYQLADAKTCTKADAAGLSRVGIASAIVFAVFTLVGMVVLLYFLMTNCCSQPKRSSVYETVATSEKI